MSTLEGKNFHTPDQIMPFPNGKADVVTVGGLTVSRAVFEPRWRWSESMKAAAGTDSCQKHHVAYIVSGRIGVRMNDGSEAKFGPGDVVVIPPGHDAWTIGDEPAIFLDFGEALARQAHG